MKHLIGINKSKALAGQRRFSNDDLAVLEDLFYEGFQRQFQGYGACVISGCEVSGQVGAFTVAPGLVYINNKLVLFEGVQNYDIKSNTFMVEDEPAYLSDRLYDSVSEERPGVIQYRAKLTEGSYVGDGILIKQTGPEKLYYNLLGDRIYLQQFQRMSRDILPIGSIIMWSGTTDNFDSSGLGKEAMSGWAVCNGNNSTPDMRSRFPVGWDKDVPEYASLRSTGGQKEVTLGINNLPKHRHVPTPNGGEGGLIKKSVTGQATTIDDAVDAIGSGSQVDLVNPPVADKEVGDNQPHENRPPFIVVAYLMKINAGSISSGGGTGTGTGGGDTGGGSGSGCNLQAMQVLGTYLFNNSTVVVIYHQGEFWPFNIWSTVSPRRAYVRGRNFLTWTQFSPAGTLPNIGCFAPYETAYDGREHPAAFNGAPEGWTRTTDEGGYVCFDEVLVGTGGGGQTGSGSGDINSTIIFETEVA